MSGPERERPRASETLLARRTPSRSRRTRSASPRGPASPRARWRSRSCSARGRAADARGPGGHRRWPAGERPSRSPSTASSSTAMSSTSPSTSLAPVTPQGAGEELAPAGAEVIDDHDLDACGAQPVGEVAADESRAAGDARPSHTGDCPHRRYGIRHATWAGLIVYRVKPAAAASPWNIRTVSSEYCSRLLPRQSSFLSRSWVIGDDVAADLIGLHQIEDLARRGPDQLRLRGLRHDLDRPSHDRHGIDARRRRCARRRPRHRRALRP